jgi:predicted nucleic acid-binding protein
MDIFLRKLLCVRAHWKPMPDLTTGVLLDTSVVIAHLRGEIDLRSLSTPSQPLFISLVALGELYKGAYKSNKPVVNAQQINIFS